MGNFPTSHISFFQLMLLSISLHVNVKMFLCLVACACRIPSMFMVAVVIWPSCESSFGSQILMAAVAWIKLIASILKCE